MDANLENCVVVRCPQCNNNEFSIFRREIVENDFMLNHCMCSKCSTFFEFKIDKSGNIITY